MPTDSPIRRVLAARWRATAAGPFFKTNRPPPFFTDKLPDDYLEVIADFGGMEGFLGANYLRLYRFDELVEVNLAYDVPNFFPEALVFASDGCGEAFAFSLENGHVIQVPFIPLSAEHARFCAPSVSDFVRLLADSGESSESNPDAVGMEVHEKHPICFGGDPVDESNKVLVPPAKHAEIARFWNKVYRDAVARKSRGG